MCVHWRGSPLPLALLPPPSINAAHRLDTEVSVAPRLDAGQLRRRAIGVEAVVFRAEGVIAVERGALGRGLGVHPVLTGIDGLRCPLRTSSKSEAASRTRSIIRASYRQTYRASAIGDQVRYVAGTADRRGGKSASRSAASTWKRSTGSGRPRNRQAPRLLRLTPSASDSRTAARTAEDITIWPPCAAKQMRAAAWTESPT